MKRIIGIDPGNKGFISVYDERGWTFFSIQDNDTRSLAEFLKENYREDSVVVMEEIHAVFGSSAAATFSFGEIFGLLKGLILANGYSYHLIPPKTWQAAIWSNEDKIYKYGKVSAKTGKPTKQVDTKPTSFNSARRIFPNIDLRRSPKCKNLDDNKCDSILIVEYARRANL